jgi:hypothetical protein
VFERFTERARQVVVLAQEEARTLKHDYIGTEHILLGLLREQEGLGARVLESLDVSLEGVRGRVVAIVGAGREASSGQIPLTPSAKTVLERALREALSLGHNHIGTEHLLLGLVRYDEGVAAQILLELDADPEKIVARTVAMLGASGARAVRGGEPGAEDPWQWQESWQPAARWQEARIEWSAEGGAVLEIPLALERRAVAVLEDDEVWGAPALAGLEHEISRGALRLRGAALLAGVDPRELRRVLDQAVSHAHEEAMASRARETDLAEAFLAGLREEPDA